MIIQRQWVSESWVMGQTWGRIEPNFGMQGHTLDIVTVFGFRQNQLRGFESLFVWSPSVCIIVCWHASQWT